VKLQPPKKGQVKESTRRSAEREYRKGESHSRKKASPRIHRIREEVLKREPHAAASHAALSKQAKEAVRKRGRASLGAAARKAVRTKGPRVLKAEAQKAARTRQRHRKAA
jgi:protein required for attachment to host cells